MSSYFPINNTPPLEHHYTLADATQIKKTIDNTSISFQLDLFYDLLKAVEDHDIKRIITIIDALPESFRKSTKKLFAEIGELKKKTFYLEQKNEKLQKDIDYLYNALQIEKVGIYDPFSLFTQ